MTYEGLATLVIRLAALALICAQAVGMLTIMMMMPKAGPVLGGAVISIAAGLLLLGLSRPLAKLISAGL